MASGMNDTAAPRLERSCGPAPGDWMRVAPSSAGIERIEAYFAGHGYDPHRHDTYALGVTSEGVQAFRYKGQSRQSVPGQVYALHPDEAHDGHAGTPQGFRYRSLYIQPELVRAALGERTALPFLRETVSGDPRLLAAVRRAVADLERPLEELQRDQIIVDIADALAAADASFPQRHLTACHARAVTVARERLETNLRSGVTSAELEAMTGLTRYALARHFRRALGTSPYRYLVMRRLDRARRLIQRGSPLADAALHSGFADQSHMTRHFKRAYGLSPGQWARVSRAVTDATV